MSSQHYSPWQRTRTRGRLLPRSRFPGLTTSACFRSVIVRRARGILRNGGARGGWSVRQLDRQIASLFYERAALSKNKTNMLTKGAKSLLEDRVSPDEEIRDPFVFFEFLGLKDEYSENDLEEALIRHIEHFLLELGGETLLSSAAKNDCASAMNGIVWTCCSSTVDCAVSSSSILKSATRRTPSAGQMHLYLNYAREHWSQPEENPPVGLILCAQKDEALASTLWKVCLTKFSRANTSSCCPMKKLSHENLK